MPTTTAVPDASALRRELGYLTEQEVCALLGVSLGRMRVRQCDGTAPPHYKLGRQKVYKRAELEAWIRRQRVSRCAA